MSQPAFVLQLRHAADTRPVGSALPRPFPPNDTLRRYEHHNRPLPPTQPTALDVSRLARSRAQGEIRMAARPDGLTIPID